MSSASEGDAADQPAAAGTERTIGRSKIRYKSEEGMMNGLGLARWVWSGVVGLHLGDLIAT